MNGGGTDDTTILQAVLDRAARGVSVHLVIDGTALVSGLNACGNTTIECVAGGGLYLKDGSNRAIIRNAHRSRDAITDEHITIRGCFLNGTRYVKTVRPPLYLEGMKFEIPREPDGTYISGLQFFGVNDLTIENTTLWHARSFSIWVANALMRAVSP